MTAFLAECAAFSAALQFVKGCVPPRSTIPILEHIEIIANAGTLVIRATDMTMDATAICPAEIENAGTITVLGAMLAAMVAKLPKGGEVRIQTEDDGRATVSCGKSRYQIRTLPADDFPSRRELASGAASWSMAGSDLLEMLTLTRGSVGTGADRPYLAGVHVHYDRPGNSGGSIVAVSTDGHRLVRCTKIAPDGAELIPKDMIIPADAIRQIDAITGGGAVEIHTDGVRVEFTAGGLSFSTALVAGTYPDYRRLIPQKNGAMFSTSADDFGDAIERAMVVFSAEMNGAAVTISIDGGALSISTSASKGDAGREEVSIDDGVDGSSMKVNGKYLRDALSLWGDAVVSVQQSGFGAPVMLTSDARPEMTQLIMPFNR